MIQLDEVPIVKGAIRSDRRFSPAPADRLANAGIPVAELQPALHPLAQGAGWWLEQAQWERIEKKHPALVWRDPLQYPLAHLEAVLRANLTQFFNLEEVSQFVETLTPTPANASAGTFSDAALERLTWVLRALVRERVPITNRARIFVEFLTSAGPETSPDELLTRLRGALKEDLPGNSPYARHIAVPAPVEAVILEFLRRSHGRSFLAMPAERVSATLEAIRGLLPGNEPTLVLIVDNPAARDPLRRLIEQDYQLVHVQSQAESLDEKTRRRDRAVLPLIAEWGECWRGREESYGAG
jgi:type III secretion protein V